MVKSKNFKMILKPKEKLLKYLIENKEKGPISIRELAIGSGIDYKNTYNLVQELISQRIINKKKIGNTTSIEINITSCYEIFNIEKKRTNEFLNKNPKLKLISEDIKNINYPFMIVIVFGSYINDTKSKQSDIDICIICDNKLKVDELVSKLELLTLKLEIQKFTSEEFISMINKKQNNLGNEIIKKNILLYGIENYYNLVSKWMSKE